MVLYLFLITLISVIHQTGAYQVDPTPPRQRRRQIAPPFPDGPCGGKVITIPPQDTFGIDVKLSNINIGGDLILPPRSIKVWVPPKYKESEGKHPVLYVHDGQNAIEDASSWTGASWRLTGALVRLREYGYLKNLPIVVMLESAEGDILPGIRRRHLEYGDTNVLFAQAHADFVANTVKPLIDSQFRTNPKESYAIGSSMGGNGELVLNRL
jgi:enterochelin esterase-like enzyme